MMARVGLLLGPLDVVLYSFVYGEEVRNPIQVEDVRRSQVQPTAIRQEALIRSRHLMFHKVDCT